jgi:ACR3 family arsenite efflux pump ArsB
MKISAFSYAITIIALLITLVLCLALKVRRYQQSLTILWIAIPFIYSNDSDFRYWLLVCEIVEI